MFSIKHDRRERQKEITAKLLDASEAYKANGDEFWANMLENCANGKYPKTGFNYYNGVLTYGKGARSPELVLDGDFMEMAESLIDFLRTHGAIYSPKETHEEGFCPRSHEDGDKLNDWSSVKNIFDRRVLVLDYISRVYGDRKPGVQRYLYNRIMIAMNKKLLGKEHVVYVNGEIIDIIGIREGPRNLFSIT